MVDASGFRWLRSSYCANNSCVEVGLGFLDGQVAIRDSKDRHGPVLLFTEDEWTAFLDGARTGEFDQISGRP